MIDVDITLEDRRLLALIGRLAPERDAHLTRTALKAETEAKKSMRGPKHGRTYGRGASKRGKVNGRKRVLAVRLHRASAPGEPPAVDYGVLWNSLRAGLVGPGLSELAVGAKYGRSLEYGTSRMAARPFLRPAVAAVKQFFQDGCNKLIERSLR